MALTGRCLCIARTWVRDENPYGDPTIKEVERKGGKELLADYNQRNLNFGDRICEICKTLKV